MIAQAHRVLYLSLSILILGIYSYYISSASAQQSSNTNTTQNTPPTVNAAPTRAFIPPDCIAYYRLDPRIFDNSTTAASLLPLMVQLGERTGLINDSFHPIFDALAAAGSAAAVPHTLCLLDFDGVYDDNAKNQFRVTQLQAVLILETPADHRSFIQTLAQILQHEQQRAGRAGEDQAQSIIKLENGVSIGRFQPTDWEDRKVIEWASFNDSFVVGMGKNSIAQWLSRRSADGDTKHLQQHFTKINTTHQNTNKNTISKQFLTIFINFRKLHQNMPEVLAQGRSRRMLTTWYLDNARNWFFHGSKQGKYLLFDLSWERRNDPDRTIYSRSLSLDHWPSEELDLPEPPGDFLVVIPMQFENAYSRITNAYQATLSADKLIAFDMKMKSYHARHRLSYEALWSSFKPYLVVSHYPKPPLPIPGAVTLYFELDGKNPNAKTAQNRLASLLQSFMNTDDPKELGDSKVRYDKQTKSYFLQLENAGVLRIPSWGWVANHYLVAGWGAPVITVNRTWLLDEMKNGK